MIREYIIDTIIFLFDAFWIPRAEIKKNDCVSFLVQMRTRKFTFEIYWPLKWKFQEFNLNLRFICAIYEYFWETSITDFS